MIPRQLLRPCQCVVALCIHHIEHMPVVGLPFTDPYGGTAPVLEHQTTDHSRQAINIWPDLEPVSRISWPSGIDLSVVPLAFNRVVALLHILLGPFLSF